MSAVPDTTTSAPAAAPATGRGGGCRSRGGRGRSHHRSGQGAATRTASTFKGETEEMNGHVFECYDKQSDRREYAKTVEALGSYAKKTLKYAEDLAPLFADDMATPTIDMPEDPGADQDWLTEALWTEAVKEYAARVRALRGNLVTVHAIIWGQCSESMKV